MSSFPSALTRENPSSSESIISPLSILYIKINKRTLGSSLQQYASNGPNIFVVAEKISFVMKTRAKPTHVISCCLNACSMLTGEINNYWTISALSNMHGNKKSLIKNRSQPKTHVGKLPGIHHKPSVSKAAKKGGF